VGAAVRRGRAGEIARAAARRREFLMQVGEALRTDAAGALGIGRSVRLLERVRSFTHVRRAEECLCLDVVLVGALAREFEQRMGAVVRGRGAAGQEHATRADRGERALHAELFRPLRPPRRERHSRNPCERSRSAAAALRLPLAHTSR